MSDLEQSLQLSTGVTAQDPYFSVFGCRPVVIPVIRVINYEQTRRNVETASLCNCRAVFLMDCSPHRGDRYLQRIWERLRLDFSQMWIGLNPLLRFPHQIQATYSPNIDGIWFDDGLITDDAADDEQRMAKLLSRRVRENCPKAVTFGGVPLNYRADENIDVVLADRATSLFDVVTTSGDGRGAAADPAKLALMRRAIGERPLALAGGVTARNIRGYLPDVNAFLVATSITDSASELIDADRLRNLIHAADAA